MKNSLHNLLFKTFGFMLFSLLIISCNKFGKEVKIKNSSVYYKDIPEADAKRVGDFFYRIGYFNDSNDISVQLIKPKDTVQLRFVVDKNKISPELDEQYLFIVSTLSDSIFNKAPIVVYLADTDMKDIKRVGVATGAALQSDGNTNKSEVEAILKSTEEAASKIGSNVRDINGNKIYYDNNVEVAKVNELIEYLSAGGYLEENMGHIAVLVKNNSGYVYKEAFIDEQIDSKETATALEGVATSIKQEVFNNDKFTFEVCDLQFKTRLTFNPQAK